MKRKIVLLILMVTAALGCFGQERLSLDDVRALALASSPALARLNLSVENSELEDRSRLYDMMPSLSLGANASASVWGEPGFADSLSAGASFGLNQKIWDGGKNSVLKAINRLSTEIARQEALAEYYAVLDSADSFYYTVLEAKASLDAAESALASAVLAFSVAEIQVTGGMISYGDYLQAVAEQESKKTSANLARRDLSLALARLKNTIGFTGSMELEEINFENYESLIQRLSAFTEEQIESLCEALWSRMSAGNPTLTKAGLNSQKAEESVALATRDYFPSISAGFSTGLSYNQSGGLEYSSGKLTLSASIPLNFWVTANSVESKKNAREQSRLDYGSTESSLRIEMQSAVLDCVAQASSVVSSRRAFEYSQRHYDNNLELFRLSQASVSELSDAAALLSSNQNQLIKAQYSFLSSLSAIRSLGGFSGEEDVLALLISALR